MKIKFVLPSFKIQTSLNSLRILKHLEKAGRTCYQSEKKITNNSCEKFIKGIINRGHESVLEHFSFSVVFTCSRAISHQIVRHRLCSFSEQSQRYCRFGSKVQLQVIIPHWIPEQDKEFLLKLSTYNIGPIDDIYENFQNLSTETLLWFHTIANSVDSYEGLLEAGFKPEEARSVLPNSIKTEIVVTANIREWRHILKLRTSPAADSEMRELMIPFLKELKTKLPIIFDDIEV